MEMTDKTTLISHCCFISPQIQWFHTCVLSLSLCESRLRIQSAGSSAQSCMRSSLVWSLRFSSNLTDALQYRALGSCFKASNQASDLGILFERTQPFRSGLPNIIFLLITQSQLTRDLNYTCKNPLPLSYEAMVTRVSITHSHILTPSPRGGNET